MKISILGSGNVAGSLAARFHTTGHALSVGSRAPRGAAAKPDFTGLRVVASGEAVRDADLVFLAIPFSAAAAELPALAESLAGRIVVDCTNPLNADHSGLLVGHTTSAGEEVARLLPGARLVKGFNTLFADVIRHGGTRGPAPTLFLAGDDPEAKERVVGLGRELGFAPLDAGGLQAARYLEPLVMLGIGLAYGLGHGTAISPTYQGL